MGMPPRFEWAFALNIGETVGEIDILVDSHPVNGQRAKPEREIGDGAFGQRLEAVDLDDQRRWGEPLEDVRIAVEIDDPRQRAIDGKMVFENRHEFRLQYRRSQTINGIDKTAKRGRFLIRFEGPFRAMLHIF